MPDVESKVFPIEALREFSTRIFLHFGVPQSRRRASRRRARLRRSSRHRFPRRRPPLQLRRNAQRRPHQSQAADHNRSLHHEHRHHRWRQRPRSRGWPASRIASPWTWRKKPAPAGSAYATPITSASPAITSCKRSNAILIGWAMTNSTSLVAPLWGAERMLGTNPIAIAFPGKEEPPIVIDMATCAAAYGKIEIARRRGEPIPTGWGIDAQGRPTTNPDDIINGGALLPLGSDRERGGHKGYGLGIMVDVLCAVLSGANWGPFAPPFALRQEIPRPQRRQRHRPFLRSDAYRRLHRPRRIQSARSTNTSAVFRATKPAPGTTGPLIPGDPEREAEKTRRRKGVPLLLPWSRISVPSPSRPVSRSSRARGARIARLCLSKRRTALSTTNALCFSRPDGWP